MKTWKIRHLFVFRFITDSIFWYPELKLTVSFGTQIYNWQYLFVFHLQLTVSNTAANATTVTTTIITFLFTIAATFQGELNH
jgi:hypothetical protein